MPAGWPLPQHPLASARARCKSGQAGPLYSMASTRSGAGNRLSRKVVGTAARLQLPLVSVRARAWGGPGWTKAATPNIHGCV